MSSFKGKKKGQTSEPSVVKQSQYVSPEPSTPSSSTTSTVSEEIKLTPFAARRAARRARRAARRAARRERWKRRYDKYCRHCKCKKTHFYFYYHDHTDFLVMRWKRNPLMYALWATICSCYTVSMCIHSALTTPDGTKELVEVTSWGFYALTFRFMITSINAWRFVKHHGITTLPDDDDEDVIIVETITAAPGDDDYSSVGSFVLSVDDMNATISRLESVDSQSQVKPDREVSHGKKKTIDRDHMKSMLAKIYVAMQGDKKDELNCLDTIANSTLDSISEDLASEQSKKPSAMKKATKRSENEEYTSEESVSDLSRNPLWRKATQNFETPQHTKNSNVNLPRDTNTNRTPVSITNFLPNTNTKQLQNINANSTKPHIPDKLQIKRRRKSVAKRQTIVYGGDSEYLEDAPESKHKRRCCCCCCGCRSVLVKTVNVPVIDDMQYDNGAAGHFLVRTVKKDSATLYKLPWMLATQWIVQNISNNMALVITAFYWINYFRTLYLNETKHNVVWRTVNAHMVNTIIANVDMQLSSAPVRFAHFYMAMLFMLVYVGFTLTYWKVGGRNHEGNPFVYEFLDYDNKPWEALKFILLFVFVIIPISQLIIFLQFRLREKIFRRIHKVKKRVRQHIKKREKKRESYRANLPSMNPGLGNDSPVTWSSPINDY